MWPRSFEERLAMIYDATTSAAILASMHSPKAFALWDNPLISGEIAQLLSDLALPQPQTVLPGVYRLEGQHRESVMRHRLVAEGALYPINPSSVVAAQALGVCPGDEVLDLAAAPGGKSLLLSAALSPGGRVTGRLALVESVKPRFHRLRANMQRCGVPQADYYLRDGRGVGAAVGERFDRVLLDAPCSSESRFHSSRPDSAAQWSPRKIKECARKQRRLLRSAYRALRPGGVLVYSTCAFAPEENEMVVEHLLQAEPGSKLTSLNDIAVPGELKRSGLVTWNDKPLHTSDAVRILPDDLWNGFFLARISKPA